MSKIAGLYARVSTSTQEEAQTIESQLAEIRERVAKDCNVLPPENEFIDDGWTGTVLERPALDAMRDAGVAGQFEVLYVYDRGRLSRIFAYQEIIIEELTNKGVEFVTLHDVAANTPEEHVLQAMQGVFHEYERVKIVERFRRGKLHKARNGVLINGGALYGYRYIKTNGDQPARYEIDDYESTVVKKIFEWVGIDRLSVYEVRKRLLEEGVTPRKGKSEKWSRGPIVRILRNRSYVDGVIYYNKSEAIVSKNPTNKSKYHKIKKGSRKARPSDEWIPYRVEAILEDNELFEKVQAVMDYYRKYQPKNKKYDYLLSGLSWCECGQRRVGDGSSKYGHHYYRCIDRIKKNPYPSSCKSHGVNAVLADGFLWMNLERFLADKEAMRNQAKKWLMSGQASTGQNSGELTRLESQLVVLEQEKLRYTKAYGTGTIEEAQLKVLLEEINRKHKMLVGRIEELKKVDPNSEITDNLVDKLCAEATLVLADQTQSDKKKLVQDIINKVTFYDGGRVEVVGHLPQFTQKLGYELERRNCWVAKRGEEHAL